MGGKIRIVGIGDSWMARYSDALKADADASGLLGLLNPSRFSFVNLAKSGMTAERLAEDEDGRLSKAVGLAGECDCYAVSLLGNDAYAAISPSGDGGASITFAEISSAIQNMRSVLEELKSTGKRVLVMRYTNPYPGNLQTSAGCNVLNIGIGYAADLAGVPYTDLIESSETLSSPGMMSGIGIHPKDPDGYMALAKLIGGMFP